jgi:hypothetical protein
MTHVGGSCQRQPGTLTRISSTNCSRFALLHDAQLVGSLTCCSQAASYGALFCEEGWSANDFVDTCRGLRVLNTVRRAEVRVGVRHHTARQNSTCSSVQILAMTWQQYQRLTATALIQRLANLRRTPPALRVLVEAAGLMRNGLRRASDGHPRVRVSAHLAAERANPLGADQGRAPPGLQPPRPPSAAAERGVRSCVLARRSPSPTSGTTTRSWRRSSSPSWTTRGTRTSLTTR